MVNTIEYGCVQGTSIVKIWWRYLAHWLAGRTNEGSFTIDEAADCVLHGPPLQLPLGHQIQSHLPPYSESYRGKLIITLLQSV